MNRFSDEMRACFARYLPAAILTAVKSYTDFVNAGAEEKKPSDPNKEETRLYAEIAKNFKSHHDACKVALGHIELLMKLAREIDASGGVEDESQRLVLVHAIETAQAEIESSEQGSDNA